jgi:hypothetical protein
MTPSRKKGTGTAHDRKIDQAIAQLDGANSVCARTLVGRHDLLGLYESPRRETESRVEWTLPEPWTHQNAPTAPWKTADGFHERPPPSSIPGSQENHKAGIKLAHDRRK